MGTSRSEAGDASLILSAAFLLVPAVFFPGLSSVFVLPKLGVCAAAVLAGGLSIALGRTGRSLSGSLDVPLAAWLAVFAAAAAFSIDPLFSLYGRDEDVLFGLAGTAGCVGAYYLGVAASRERESSAPLLGACLGAAAAAVPACLQASGADIFGSTFWTVNRRASSTFGNPVVLGAYLATAFPLTLHLALSARPARWLGRVSALLCAAALLLSGTRGGWLGAAAGSAFYAVFRFVPAGKRARAAPSALRRFGDCARGERLRAAPSAAVLIVGLLAAASVLRDSREMSMSDRGRLELWEIAGKEFLDRPWLGSGPDTYAIVFSRRESEALARIHTGSEGQDNAHNDWLQVLATMGTIGLAAYAWLHVSAARAALEVLGEDRGGAAAAALGAAAALLIHAKFNPPGFAAAWTACALTGTALGKAGRRAGLRGKSVAVLIGAACALFFSARSAVMLAADAYAASGAAARRAGRPRAAAEAFEKAIGLNPDRTEYRYDLANLIWDVERDAELSREARARLLSRAAEAAREGVRRHPLSMSLHRLEGLAELKRHRRLGEDSLGRARAALERAYALAPHYKSTIRELAETAEAAGDRARTDELNAHLKRIGG